MSSTLATGKSSCCSHSCPQPVPVIIIDNSTILYYSCTGFFVSSICGFKPVYDFSSTSQIYGTLCLSSTIPIKYSKVAWDHLHCVLSSLSSFLCFTTLHSEYNHNIDTFLLYCTSFLLFTSKQWRIAEMICVWYILSLEHHWFSA